MQQHEDEDEVWWGEEDDGTDGPHLCMKSHPHEGRHVCCCGERMAWDYRTWIKQWLK